MSDSFAVPSLIPFAALVRAQTLQEFVFATWATCHWVTGP